MLDVFCKPVLFRHGKPPSWFLIRWLQAYVIENSGTGHRPFSTVFTPFIVLEQRKSAALHQRNVALVMVRYGLPDQSSGYHVTLPGYTAMDAHPLPAKIKLTGQGSAW
jgi:hypothetical protein